MAEGIRHPEAAQGFVLDAFMRYARTNYRRRFLEDSRFLELRDSVGRYISQLGLREALDVIRELKHSFTGKNGPIDETFSGGDFLAPLVIPVLERVATHELDPGNVREWRDLYSIVEVVFENDKRSLSQLQYKIAEKAVRLMSFEEARTFLSSLGKKGNVPLGAADYFQEHLMMTPENRRSATEVADSVLSNLQKQGNESVGALASFDFLFEKSMEYLFSSEEILSAALESRTDDSKLRAVLAKAWYQAYRQLLPEFKDTGSLQKIYNKGGWGSELLHPFVPFDEFVEQFYKQVSQLDVDVMLHKLLLSPKGALRSWDGRRLIVNILKSEMDDSDPELQKLIVDIGRGALNKVDPVRLYGPLADMLRNRIFIKPPKPGKNTQAINGLKEKIWEPRDLLHVRGITMQRKFVDTLFAFRKPGKTKGGGRPKEEPFIPRELMDACREHIRSMFTESERETSQKKLQPLDYVLNVANNMGAVGVRFLQLLGQYIDIPESYRDKFDSVYDAVRGQLKWTAWQTLEREANSTRATPELKSFYENLAELSPSIGGGSLMTVYLATLKDGRRFVMKVLNPNAEEFIRQYIADGRNILKQLNEKNYPFVKTLLADLETWLMEDINSRHKTSPADEFVELHGVRDINVGNGKPSVRVSAPTQMPTGTKYILIEDFIDGRNLSELIASGDPQAKDYVRALELSYREQLTMFASDGKTRIHPDVHIGNARVGKDGILYWIDRGHYIECTKDEIEVLEPFLQGNGTLGTINKALTYLFDLPENRDLKEKSKKVSFQVRMARELLRLATQFRGNNGNDLANKFLVTLREEGLNIPIRYSLLLKNARAIEKMRERASDK